MVVCDGLKGLPDAIGQTWPGAVVQTCIIHLLRASFRYAGRQHWDAIAKALKPVYTAATEAAGRERFAEFTQAWGTKYPAIIRLWEQAGAEFVPFLAFDTEIRTVICSTNAIESVNARIRRAVASPWPLPQRGRRPQMRLPRRDEPGPDRAGPPAMDHALETRPERLRDGLRRTPDRRPKVTLNNPGYTVRLTDPEGLRSVLGP
ncbi:mutator family transposase [Micromonospora endolithica]|nr:mutator family transposase [Micromonospora endolithica]